MIVGLDGSPAYRNRHRLLPVQSGHLLRLRPTIFVVTSTTSSSNSSTRTVTYGRIMNLGNRHFACIQKYRVTAGATTKLRQLEATTHSNNKKTRTNRRNHQHLNHASCSGLGYCCVTRTNGRVITSLRGVNHTLRRGRTIAKVSTLPCHFKTMPVV